MGRNRRTRRDRLASSLRGQVVVVVGVLLALLAGSVVFDRSARDEASPTSTLAKPATSSAVARSDDAVQSDPIRIQLRLRAIATVITGTGRISYVVTSVTSYPKRSLAKHAAELFEHNTQGRLVLVTCDNRVHVSSVERLASARQY
ncbi:hypothetical protein [Kribbella sp. NBC_00889]|uniref:hypothetical protein n=1 Tax=Kribbella sp. NBC_00889 TaxID=2975974 RepID=UPI003866CC1E|nr:hypothetical protein OG817_26075 [Kribbella sp. NBC_00889]